MASVRKFLNGGANLEGNLPLLQDKALIGHVLDDLKEVSSIVREASAQQFDRMCTLKKMDECLRRTLANGRRTDDLITKFNDEEDRVVTAASKESLKNVSHLYKEVDASEDLDKQLVVMDDVLLLEKHLKCLTMTDGGEDDKWLGDEVIDVVIEIMCHHNPKNTRDGHVVYIERVAGVAMLERDGKEEEAAPVVKRKLANTRCQLSDVSSLHSSKCEYNSGDYVEDGNKESFIEKEAQKIREKGKTTYFKWGKFMCPYCTTKPKPKDGIHEHLMSRALGLSRNVNDIKVRADHATLLKAMGPI
ncbi:hypothetical protein D1007_37123 [Hordeum vulgare]|nr:hypothetical protein D1007_37123 [Hordeum vulgare]